MLTREELTYLEDKQECRQERQVPNTEAPSPPAMRVSGTKQLLSLSVGVHSSHSRYPLQSSYRMALKLHFEGSISFSQDSPWQAN